jgi:hypothetical protein
MINSISTLMYTVWHVDKYKITFKLVSSGLSRPGIIDASAQYRTAARRLRNTDLGHHKFYTDPTRGPEPWYGLHLQR